MTNEPRIGDFFFPEEIDSPVSEILICIKGSDGESVSLWETYEPSKKYKGTRWEGVTKEGQHRPVSLSGEIIEGCILPNRYCPMLSEHVLKAVDLLEYLKVEDRWNPLSHYLSKDKLDYPYGKWPCREQVTL